MVVGTEENVKNKIIVVSSLLESPTSILSKIISKDDLTLRPIYSDEIQAANWQIDTKYYTADVEFWILNQHNYPPTQLPLSSEQLGDLCEALILVFDATKNESFEKLRAWEEFVAEYNPNVLLCVGIGKTENRSVYNEWCISNGIEFVQVDAINPSEPQEEDEDRFGGTEGKDRIIEALGTTMWANMKQKARATRGLEEQFSSMLSLAGESDDDEGLDEITTNNDNDNTNTNIPAPTFDPFNFDEDIRLARGEFKHATDDISNNLLSLQNFLKETEQQEKEGKKEGGEDADETDVNLSTEANVEHFESALTGLRRLRENAQQLPDSQRKALAAHVISMLFPDVEDWQD